MKIKLLIVICFLSVKSFSQVQPAWTTTAPTDFNSASCTPDGGIFVTGTGTSVINCSAAYAYGVVLSNNGILTWERAYDTANCSSDNSFSCSIINAQPPCFATSTSNSNSLDTGRIVIYNSSGNLLSDSIWEFYNGGGGAPIVGNMGDNYLYGSKFFDVFKTDSFGHRIWTYNGSDSVSRAFVLFDSIQSTILIGSSDFRSTDWLTDLKGLDTSGNLIFETSYNFFTTPFETPIAAWISNGTKLYGFTKDGSGQYKAYGLDTSGSLLWQRNVLGYLHSDYDSVHNVLHYTASVNSQIKRCYKLDCTNGALLDSITIDSCGLSFPLCKVDKYGNVYLCYPVSNMPTSTYRIEQYKPNYYYNWTGMFIDSVGGFLPRNFFINDSCNVFLINGDANKMMISKYYPPFLNAISNMEMFVKVNIFPNPTSSSLSYNFTPSPEKPCQYLITNLEGRVVRSGKCNPSGKGEIDISSLSPSVYFISIVNEHGEMITAPKKIIKL